MESSEFESVFEQNPSMEQKLHDGKYFCIEKVKYKHRWEIRKSIQEKQKSNPVCIESLKREFEIGSQLQHPFICSYYQYSLNDNYIHREYIDGLSWNDYFDAHKEEVSNYKNYAIQLLEAIQYIHSKGIFHMDLKSENILINHELKTIKLIDFGHAVYRNDELWRGGVKVTLNPDNLISAEHDWNAYFSVIGALKYLLSRNWNVKLEKAYRLFITNQQRIDYQKTKLIFEDNTKIKYRIKLTALISIVFIFLFGINQSNKTKESEDLRKTAQPNNDSLHSKSVTVPDLIQPTPAVNIEKNTDNKIPVKTKKNEMRIIPLEDSLFLVNKASQFGPEFEEKLKIPGNLYDRYKLHIELIDEYELRFKNFLQTRKYDLPQKTKAKNIYAYQLSLSMNKYVHLLK